jgi:hypothetical protein
MNQNFFDDIQIQEQIKKSRERFNLVHKDLEISNKPHLLLKEYYNNGKKLRIYISSLGNWGLLELSQDLTGYITDIKMERAFLGIYKPKNELLLLYK